MFDLPDSFGAGLPEPGGITCYLGTVAAGGEVATRSTAQVVEWFKQRRAAYGGRPTRSYSSVGVVYSCVRARADGLSLMPLMISQADDQVIESGPLAELATRPNPGQTSRSFFKATSAMLDLFGSVHWVFTLDAAGRPLEIYPVSPLQMEAVLDRRSNELLAWKYLAAGRHKGQEETLPLDAVHTILDPDFEDPHNPLEGLSPRQAVTLAISQYFKAQLVNENSLDNGVEPGGAFVHPGSPTVEQQNKIRAALQERHAGVRLNLETVKRVADVSHPRRLQPGAA